MDDILKKVENKTGVKSNDIKSLAQSVNGANFSDEDNIRRLVKEVAQMANKDVSQSTEDQIVKALTKEKGKVDASTISKML